MQDAYAASNAAQRESSHGDPLAQGEAFALACLPMAVAQTWADILAEFSHRAAVPGNASEAVEQTALVLRGLQAALTAAFRERLAEAVMGRAELGADLARDTASRCAQPGLMREDEHDDFTAPDAIAAAISTACTIELYSLDKRFEFVRGVQAHREIRFGPRVVSHALMAAMKRVAMPLPVRRMLLPSLIAHLPGNVGTAYRALNQALIGLGVLPLMRGGAMNQQDIDPLASACWDWIAPHIECRAAPAVTLRPVLVPRPEARDWAALMRDAGLDIDGLSGGGANLARELAFVLAEKLGAADRVLLNWAAVLFDGFFIRTDIAEAYRVVLGRMQWPLLKAVLTERERLSDDMAHPAQRLFGAWIAAIVEDEAAEALLGHMDVVAAAMCAADKPIGFADAWGRWCAFRPSGLANAEDAEDADWRECAVEPIRAAIAQRRLPGALEPFLVEHRLRVLRGVKARHGDTGSEWQDAVAVMDALLESLVPANWRRDRAGLSRSLPGMLGRLRDLLEQAGVAAPVRDKFFADLVKYHALLMPAMRGRPADVG